VFVGEPDRLPGVVDVPDEEGQPDAGYDLPEHDLVHNFFRHATQPDQALDGEQGAEQRRQVIEEQLRQTSQVAARHGNAILEGLDL